MCPSFACGRGHTRGGARLASLRLARSYPSIVYFVISPGNLLRSFPVSITRIQRTPPRFTWTAGGHAPASVSPLLRRVLGLFPRRLALSPPFRRVFGVFSRRLTLFPPFRRVLGVFSRRDARFRQIAPRAAITIPSWSCVWGRPSTFPRGTTPDFGTSATPHP